MTTPEMEADRVLEQLLPAAVASAEDAF